MIKYGLYLDIFIYIVNNMIKNKCTLLIDGNWLLISRFSIMKNLFDSNNNERELNIAKEKLKDMLAMSIFTVLRRLPEVDNIILISDGGSWRKNLPIPHQLEDITYKGNRSHGGEMAWNYIFKAFNELSDACQANGITTCHEFDVEGDDWCWYWSRYLNDQNINCIIWTSDHDLIQLVRENTYSSVVWYNERSNISTTYIPESMQETKPDPGDFDFFMQPIKYKSPIIESFLNKMNKINYINPDSIINEKVICGDSGDNIKSVARIMKNDRCYGVGKSDWKKISDKYNINTIQDLINHIDDVSESITHIKKFKDVPIDDVQELIRYNIQLVWLDKSTIPQEIQDRMRSVEYKTIDIEYFKGSYKTLLGNNEPETQEIMNIFES